MRYEIVYVIGQHGKDVVEKFVNPDDAIAHYNTVCKTVQQNRCSNACLYQIVDNKRMHVTTYTFWHCFDGKIVSNREAVTKDYNVLSYMPTDKVMKHQRFTQPEWDALLAFEAKYREVTI